MNIVHLTVAETLMVQSGELCFSFFHSNKYVLHDTGRLYVHITILIRTHFVNENKMIHDSARTGRQSIVDMHQHWRIACDCNGSAGRARTIASPFDLMIQWSENNCRYSTRVEYKNPHRQQVEQVAHDNK